MKTQLGSLALLLAFAATPACSQDALDEARPEATRASSLFVLEGRATPDPGTLGMSFGRAVLAAGDDVFVGAPGASNGEGAAYPLIGGGGGWFVDATTFRHPEVSPGDGAGTSLAREGNLLVVGAPDARDGSTPVGLVYAFSVDGSSSPAKLEIATGDPLRLGASVAARNNMILAGGPGHVPEGFSSPGPGAVFVFTRANASAPWEEQFPPIFDANAPPGGDFGAELSLDGDRLAVGGPMSTPRGQVYVYDFDGTDWVLDEKFSDTPGQSGFDSDARFGSALALKGSTLLVGAPEAADGQGVVVLFERDPANGWGATHRFENPDPSDGDRFGADVAIERNRVLIGAPGAMSDGEPLGLAYLYELGEDRSWSAPQTLRAADTAPSTSPTTGAFFGASVSLDRDRAVVGAWGSSEDVDGNPTDRVGSAHVFTFTDAGPDAGPDAGVDTGSDASTDAGSDAGPNMDAGEPLDAGSDASSGTSEGDAATGRDASPSNKEKPEYTSCAASPGRAPAPLGGLLLALCALLSLRRRSARSRETRMFAQGDSL